MRVPAVLGILLATLPSAGAHRLDEYLQATRLAIHLDRLDLELDLTPGVAVAPKVISWIDTNGDGEISGAERDAYVRQVLSSVTLLLDGSPVRMVQGKTHFPLPAEMGLGVGTIQLRASAKVPAAGAGFHRLSFLNWHRPGLSVYLVNALVPVEPRIQIGEQRRDRAQRGITLDFTVAGDARWVWGFALLVGLLIGGRWFVLLRGAWKARASGSTLGLVQRSFQTIRMRGSVYLLNRRGVPSTNSARHKHNIHHGA